MRLVVYRFFSHTMKNGVVQAACKRWWWLPCFDKTWRVGRWRNKVEPLLGSSKAWSRSYRECAESIINRWERAIFLRMYMNIRMSLYSRTSLRIGMPLIWELVKVKYVWAWSSKPYPKFAESTIYVNSQAEDVLVIKDAHIQKKGNPRPNFTKVFIEYKITCNIEICKKKYYLETSFLLKGLPIFVASWAHCPHLAG